MSGHAGGSRTEKLRVDYPTLPIVCKPASVAEIEAAIVAAQPVGTIRISDKPEQTIVRTRPSRDTK